MSNPDPPVQVRLRLEVSKRQGVPFAIAWRSARSWAKNPHDREDRRQWGEVLDELEPVFRDAYENRGEIRGAGALVALQTLVREKLYGADPDGAPTRRGAPPVVSHSREPRDIEAAA